MCQVYTHPALYRCYVMHNDFIFYVMCYHIIPVSGFVIGEGLMRERERERGQMPAIPEEKEQHSNKPVYWIRRLLVLLLLPSSGRPATPNRSKMCSPLKRLVGARVGRPQYKFPRLDMYRVSVWLDACKVQGLSLSLLFSLSRHNRLDV